MCTGENLVSKSPRQVEASTGGRTGEDKDGSPRTVDRVGPRHAVLPVRTTWIPSVAGRIRTRHRPDSGSPFQPTRRGDGFARWPTDLCIFNFCRQRRRGCLPSLASPQVEFLNILSRQLVVRATVRYSTSVKRSTKCRSELERDNFNNLDGNSKNI